MPSGDGRNRGKLSPARLAVRAAAAAAAAGAAEAIDDAAAAASPLLPPSPLSGRRSSGASGRRSGSGSGPLTTRNMERLRAQQGGAVTTGRGGLLDSVGQPAQHRVARLHQTLC